MVSGFDRLFPRFRPLLPARTRTFAAAGSPNSLNSIVEMSFVDDHDVTTTMEALVMPHWLKNSPAKS